MGPRRKLLLTAVFSTALLPVQTSPASAEIVSVLPCSSSAVHITEYNTVVGAGNVNSLFWIRNVSGTRCSLRGYVRAGYVGHYGVEVKGAHATLLTVAQSDRPGGGKNLNDIGGLHDGAVISTVVIEPHALASFWIYGTDESTHLRDGRVTRCITALTMLVRLPGSTTPVDVTPPKGDGFFWCGPTSVHPVVSGDSGSIPSRPLSDYFGTPG